MKSPAIHILMCAAALMTCFAGAEKAFADESRPHVEAVIERERQKAAEAAAAEEAAAQGLLSLKYITTVIQEEQSRTKGVISANMFENPDKDNVLQAFRGFLAQRPINIQGGASLAPGEEANRDQIAGLYPVMKTIQNEFHPSMLRVVNTAIAGEFAKRHNKLSKTREYVDDYFIDEFKAFDEAFDRFKKDTATMQENMVTDITGTELLMSSKLGEFATDAMKTQPRFDKILRALDNHLAASDTAFLSKLREDSNILYKQHEECIKAYERTRDIIASSKYADHVAGIMGNYAELIAQVEKLCVSIDMLIREAEREDTAWGKIRHASASLAPHGALRAGASAAGAEKGTPFYSRRVRLAILECQAFYQESVKRMNASNRNTPGYTPIPTEWR
ncbi:MAG: hypothetical protein J5855_10350 [Mailhella sp.]|nr:hypothetical protein [Mailhella sp.]